MADRVGQQLGNYRLIRLLGQGGFADVYLGQHLHLDSQAAIKVMHTHLAQEEWESFRKEARIIAGLTHPHIVRLLDFDVEDGTPFLVMQFAPNGTLRRRHPPGCALAPEVILPYVQQVAEALTYVHERKLIHRDIKPENLLLGPENEVLLSDFGVAIIAQTSRQQSSQNLGGTVAYMAPEQIQSKPCPASDQYALGIVVYEWLTGERPFDGTFTEIATKHILVSPPPLRALAPTLAPAIEEVVMRALAKDPQQRFPSAQAFAQALEAAIGPDHTTTLVARRPALVVSASSPARATPAEESLRTRALKSAPLLSPSGISTLTTPPPAPRQGISRRVVMLGLVGLAVSGGALTTWALIHPVSSSPSTQSVVPVLPATTPTTAQPPETTLLTFKRHTAPVYIAAWSPDGTKIASGGKDRQVRVWDASTGAVIGIFTGHSGAVNAVAWSPDGAKIASGSSDTTVQVWDIATQKALRIYTGHTSYVVTLAWSPDGTSIASGSGDLQANRDHAVHVWDVQTGRRLFAYEGHKAQIKQVAWSPDASRIASASVDTTVQVWSADNGAPVYTFRGHTDEVWSVVWSPNSQRLVSGSHDQTVRVWEPKRGGIELTYRGHNDYVNAVAWSPNSQYIASGGGFTGDRSQTPARDTSVQIWDAITLERRYTYSGHFDTIESVAWSPDGTRIASASDDDTVQVWKAVSPLS